jgi:hypothetical protein
MIGFTALSDGLLASTEVHGRDLAVDVFAVLTSQSREKALSQFTNWDREPEPFDRPAPMALSFIDRLADIQRLSPAQTMIITRIFAWYDVFWAHYARLCSRPAWRQSIVDAVGEYADGRRTATFQPLYETFVIDTEHFVPWTTTFSVDRLPSYMRNSPSWRGPVASLDTLADMLFPGAGPDPSRRELDFHSCGSPSFLLLGDTGHPTFEASTCWICPGTRTPCVVSSVWMSVTEQLSVRLPSGCIRPSGAEHLA